MLSLHSDHVIEPPEDFRATLARAALDLPVDAPVIGCVGRLVPVKDHATLLDAFRDFRR